MFSFVFFFGFVRPDDKYAGVSENKDTDEVVAIDKKEEIW
jgi:hypothetical protein